VTDRAQRDDAGHLHRHDIGTSLRVGQPPSGLRNQVGPAVARVRAVDAEAADGGDDEAGATRAQLVAIHAERGEVTCAGALDHEVGVIEEPSDALAAGIAGDVGQHRACSCQVQQCQGRRRAAGHRRRLHLDHVGAEIGEDLVACALAVRREIDDPHVVNSWRIGCRLLCPALCPRPGP
jgi:hypothetical protein